MLRDVRKHEVDMRTRDWMHEVAEGKREAAWDSCVAENGGHLMPGIR